MPNFIDNLLNRFKKDKPQEGKTEKEASALDYWVKRKKVEGRLKNAHYEQFYTDYFDLNLDFYKGKKILDIGCGARGSLEWAQGTDKRVGLDPLAEDYYELEGKNHQMEYIKGYSEQIPFEDNFFDVVCSFNSFDHVDNLEKTISEIKRVVKKGGLFLLLTDLHENPTLREPQVFSWDIVRRFEPELKLVMEKHYEKAPDSRGIYEGILAGKAFDHDDPKGRYGIIQAKFEKK